MNQNLFIFIFCIVLGSCTKSDRTYSVQITPESAAKIIFSEEPSTFQLDTTMYQQNDSIYSLLILEPELVQNEFHFFLKHKTEFYLFQRKKMIYQNSGSEFYKNENLTGNHYYFYPDKGKAYYRIKLANDSELTFLVKHTKKNEVQDLIEIGSAELRSKMDLVSDSIPLVEMNTFNAFLTDQDYQNAEVKISTNKEIIETAAELKIRGSSSKVFPKKQLALKSFDSLCFKGVTITKSVLYAPYSDKSLIRNKLSYDLYAQMRRISNPSVFTNVLLNGDYYGLYILLEHPKKQFKKLITNTNSFLVQMDRGPFEIIHKKSIVNGLDASYSIELPSSWSAENKEQIDDVLSSFEDGILNDDLSVLDLHSFIDFIILNELSKNIDAYRLSTYLGFDGKKVGTHIAWDYNIAWGLAEHGNAFDPKGFVIEGEYSDFHPYWWKSLWENKKFQIALKHRYSVHRKSVLSNRNIGELISQFENTLSGHQELNFKKWPLMGKKIWPNKHKAESYIEELGLLKNWIEPRLIWLDEQWSVHSTDQ